MKNFTGQQELKEIRKGSIDVIKMYNFLFKKDTYIYLKTNNQQYLRQTDKINILYK